jgi:hypothetical protein
MLIFYFSDVLGQLGARQPQCDEMVIKMRYLDLALCNNYLSSSGIVKDIDDSRCGKWCASLACALRAMGCAPEYQSMNGAYRVACQKELNVRFILSYADGGDSTTQRSA